MNIVAGLISAMNLFFGVRCLLNALNILHTSKYSQGATVLFTVLFLGMGLGGFYFLFFKSNLNMAFILGLGPWVVALLVLLITLLTSDYK
jgi:hypothetical protein